MAASPKDAAISYSVTRFSMKAPLLITASFLIGVFLLNYLSV
jgi:hypothetical protein